MIEDQRAIGSRRCFNRRVTTIAREVPNGPFHTSTELDFGRRRRRHGPRTRRDQIALLSGDAVVTTPFPIRPKTYRKRVSK